MDRRQILKLLGSTLAGSAAGVLTPGAFAQYGTNPLWIPPLLPGDPRQGRRHYDLRLAPGSRRFLPGLSTPTLGINGDYLGPTLRMAAGDAVTMHVNNRMGEPTTLHWHGLHVPVIADGGPHQVINPGDTWEPGFSILQKGGTFWYHSHLLDYTGDQVYRGLAGMIIIDDEKTRQEGLPGRYGVDDIPLVVQDRLFAPDGSFQYVRMHSDIMTGMFGDTILVNGTVSPFFTPETDKVRFRLLNGSNARTYTFAFSDGRPFSMIASDGGLLSAPVSLNGLELAPAERAEVVVDFSDGNPVDLVSLPMAADSSNNARGMMRNMHPMNSRGFDILAIRPQSRRDSSPALPAMLTEIRPMAESEAVVERRLVLSMAMGMGMGMGGGTGRGGPGAGGMGRRGMGGGMMGGDFFINGEPMNMGVINQHVIMGDTEIWEIANDSMMMHPFHIHHGQFRILSRNGQRPPLQEMGYKDTVKVGPGETVRFIMKFENFSDARRPYMYHCHILEHEDNGMMGQFIVV